MPSITNLKKEGKSTKREREKQVGMTIFLTWPIPISSRSIRVEHGLLRGSKIKNVSIMGDKRKPQIYFGFGFGDFKDP